MLLQPVVCRCGDPVHAAGSVLDHVAGWWEAYLAECEAAARQGRQGRILWVTYEELTAQPKATVARLAAFLQVPYVGPFPLG